MEEIKARLQFILMEGAGGFMIAKFKSQAPVTFPDGRSAKAFTAKGYNFSGVGIDCILTGTWTPYKGSFTLDVTSVKDVIPTDRDGVIAYLKMLGNIGPSTAVKLWETFFCSIFEIIEKEPGRLTEVPGIGKKKAEKIAASYAKKKYARELFAFLLPYNLTEHQVLKVYKELTAEGLDPVKAVKENPFLLTEISGTGFKTADALRRTLSLPPDMPERIEAGILEVLLQCETGGEVFRRNYPVPGFMYSGFLDPGVEAMLNDPALYVTGGTYMPYWFLYVMVLKLLAVEVEVSTFNNHLKQLQNRKIIIASDGKNRLIYRYKTAESEYKAARKIAKLMTRETEIYHNFPSLLKEAQQSLSILLTDQQREAVKKAITCPISIITGGPGTGKTSIEKCILSVYKALHPNEKILLCAPTGMAAKRMAESTGHPAYTLHKAMMLYQNEEGNLVDMSEELYFDAGLVVVDECSMIGSHVFKILLDHIRFGTNLVLIGDVDQLPSIEVGAVLRNAIESNCIYVTRLTKTFRQAAGSNIAINAARIRAGEEILEYGGDVEFIDAASSEDISDKICSLYPRVVKEVGIDNVIVLSAFRKSTESGTDMLNQSLRSAIRSDIDDTTPHFTANGMKIYRGDRVMFTKNTEELTNGDIGKIIDIRKNNGSLVVRAEFDGTEVTLEDDEVRHLELSYAITVHKAQGAEYNTVIMTADSAHRILLKRNLLYTALTRAKKKIYIIGMKETAFLPGIRYVDTHLRRSRLSKLIEDFDRQESERAFEKLLEGEEKEEKQIKML